MKETFYKTISNREAGGSPRTGGASLFLRALAGLLFLLFLGTPLIVFGQAIQNSATGSLGAAALDTTNATVTLNRTGAVGNAVTSVLAEINPNAVAVKSVGNIFVYDLRPTIGGSDTGINQVIITAPAGYTGLNVTGVSVGGAALTSNCPAPAAGQYCATFSGQAMTITLGANVTTSLTDLKVQFTAAAPTVVGKGDFTSTVDDTATPTMAPQSSAAGDADGISANANSISVEVKPAADPDKSTVTVDPAIVLSNGVAASAITATLRDISGQPTPGKNVDFSSDRNGVLTVDLLAKPARPAKPTDMNGVVIGTARSNVPGVATITATDTTDNVVVTMKPKIFFTQGLVLKLVKTANKKEGVVGDVITYLVEIKNTTTKDVVQVHIDDHIPPDFKYLKGSALVNKQKFADPTGNRTITFDLGTVPALVDQNGNGVADPGEPGYVTLSYQLVIGSGAKPGDYTNTAVAKDVCDLCLISNQADAKVKVTFDPIFDLGTIIGKVFFDQNKNGWQDAGEEGIAGAVVALDDGTYVTTDANGLFHFPGVAPGERLIKINKATLPPGTKVTTEEARIVQVTRGLMAKVNFGAVYDRETEHIGSSGKTGVALAPTTEREPVQIAGHIEGMQLLVNGTAVDLPLSEVRLGVEDLQETVEIKEGKLTGPISFLPVVDKPEEVWSWRLVILDPKGKVFKEIEGEGAPPQKVDWNGKGQNGKLLEGGEIYQYQMQVRHPDGTADASSKRLFGVNKTSAISLNLMGSAFETGSAEINEKTMAILHQLGETLKKYPSEKITIEGHTDDTGADDLNLALSKARAETAMAYLVEKEGIAQERFVLKWYGKSRPIASNLVPEGREMNRRVEIKGDAKEVEKATILNQLRSEPKVVINGEKVRVDPDGRFAAQIIEEIDRLNLQIANRQGKVTETTLPLPSLKILRPSERVELIYGDQNDVYKVMKAPKDRNKDPLESVVAYRLQGKTDPGARVWIDGKETPVSSEGIFEGETALRIGENIVGIVVTNSNQVTRIVNERIVLSDRDGKGKWIMAVKPVPQLSVLLPPKGSVLSHPLLPIRGMTEPGNRVRVNGKEMTIEKSGLFTGAADLPEGKSALVIEVTDSEGYNGRIEREVEVKSQSFFLMALADGEFGRISTSGSLEEAGAKKSREFYENGRLAYYLKGTIQGKYLITSAFDTGKQNFNRMFRDLDQKETDRFFTNIDPDKFYPIYGDASAVVFDAQSQGKFYLAIDGDDLHLLVGNYQTGMNDTELAAFNRTLYGGRFEYRSLSKTQYGDPDTRILLFASEVRQIHVQNTFRATGGSLYYLSSQNVVEGSEKIHLEVRDENTGLVLAQIDQTRDADYTFKYTEGRVLFNQPIASVVDNSLLIHQLVLQGHPVFVIVDFEYQAGSFQKKGYGGRVRQQIGDHLAVGGTYIEDAEAASDYQLKGADAELRVGQGTRLAGEVAQSHGKNTTNLVSEDGGLTFNEVTSSAAGQGSAYKVAGRVDLSEWFWERDRIVTEAYYKRLSPDFFSNGTLLEQGTLKYGGGARYRFTQNDTLQVKHDSEALLQNGNVLGGNAVSSAQVGASRVKLDEFQLTHTQGSVLFTGGLQNRVVEQPTGTTRQETAAARGDWKVTDRLGASLGHQWTLKGPSDRQTTLGARYSLTDNIAAVAQGMRGEHGDSALVGATARLGERSQIYLNEKLSRPEGQEAIWGTVVGGDRMLTDHLRLYTEYELQSGGVDQTRSLWGLDQRWRLSEPLNIDLHYERSRLVGNGAGTTRNVASFGLHYDLPTGSRLADRFEVRWEEGTTRRIQELTTHYGELKILSGLTLFGKFNYSVTRNQTLDLLEARFTEAGIGLAYRPFFFDRLNLISKYTHLTDQRPDPLGLSLHTKTDVGSLEAIFDLTRRIQWVEKLAVKVKGEEQAPRPLLRSQTLLSIHRLNYHLTSTWDAGLEYRILKQFQAKDQLQGFLVEIDREIAEHLRFGAGYNFTRFGDNEFSDNNYSARGWFIRAQGKF